MSVKVAVKGIIFGLKSGKMAAMGCLVLWGVDNFLLYLKFVTPIFISYPQVINYFSKVLTTSSSLIYRWRQ